MEDRSAVPEVVQREGVPEAVESSLRWSQSQVLKAQSFDISKDVAYYSCFVPPRVPNTSPGTSFRSLRCQREQPLPELRATSAPSHPSGPYRGVQEQEIVRNQRPANASWRSSSIRALHCHTVSQPMPFTCCWASLGVATASIALSVPRRRSAVTRSSIFILGITTVSPAHRQYALTAFEAYF